MTNGDERMPGTQTPAAFAAEFTERYRLGVAEFEKLRAALAPAFALGLQQALASPAHWPDLSRFLSAAPWPAAGPGAADGLLDLVLPSQALREAVSRQASAMSGVAPAIVAEAMPRLAAMGMEALMRGALGQAWPHPAGALPADDLGRLAAEMMRRGANAMEAFSTPSGAAASGLGGPLSPARFFDLYADAVRATLGGAASPGRGTAPPPDPQAPFAALFQAFATGMRSAAGAAGALNAAAPAASRPAAPAEPDPDLMQAFIQSGRRLQEAHVREMSALFARLSPGRPPDKET